MMHPYWHKVSQAIKVAVVGVSLPLLLSSAGFAQATQVGDSRIEKSIQILKDSDQDNDQEAIDLLMKIIESQKEDDEVRVLATETLVENVLVDNESHLNRKDIEQLVERLIEEVVNSSKDRPEFTKWSLYPLGKAIENQKKNLKIKDLQIKKIIDLLDDHNHPSFYERVTYPLREAVKFNNSEKLKTSLETIANNTDEDWRTRIGVAETLGFSGYHVETSMKVLTDFLLDQNKGSEKQEFALNSIEIVADELPDLAISKDSFYYWADQKDKEDIKKDWLRGLNVALEKLDVNKTPDQLDGNDISNVKKAVKNAIDVIEAAPENSWMKNRVLIAAIIIIILWFILLDLLVLFKPLWLLNISDWLEKNNLSLTLWGINISTTVVRIFLFRFQYDPRVLDAWVKTKLATASRQFNDNDTVKDREIYVPTIPVILNGKLINELTPKDLQDKFSEPRETLLICGEDGSGKTALACQLAKWAMKDDPNQRLCPNHQMLPIFIERELSDDANNQQTLIEEIHGKLESLIEEVMPISEEFVEHLLRKKRLLVIVDGYSEMSPETRQKIKPESKNFLVHALIITSRSKEILGSVKNKSIIEMKGVHHTKY
ncbi:NACHT domain-containing protein [Planktothrix agardhii]|jgi:NACHT domain|nr:NACHT domain-containing protein [Planktothrix agardhii]MCF3600383.1 NACHT domain-containing protein [Planktothrix agardhii 1032]MCF3604673.1 NACHT domain-containing protein [Planktothrix agardhii 1804]MCF3614521.1 NACHT domain-containing protein [Planktothrix agardhii 1806]MCB8780531.1 NACHT domain-containing protein [Planktothrix agardhii 1808]MCF3568278.1 NACHT domain-containing protein [Planktothrix agardhii 1807]